MASRRTPSTSGDNSPRYCDTKLQELGLNCRKNVSYGWTLTTRSMGVVKGRDGNLKCTKSDLVCRNSSSPHTCDVISLHWLPGLKRNILLSERNSSLLCVCVCVFSCFWLFATQRTARLLYPRNFPDKNTGVGCHFLLQAIFLIQGLNPSLLHWQADSLHCATWKAWKVYFSPTKKKFGMLLMQYSNN